MSFVILYISSIYMRQTRPLILTNEAIIPDMLLLNAKLYIHESLYGRSYVNLGNAIERIHKIRPQIDSESQVHIDRALADLEAVHEDMRNGEFNVDNLNASCIVALNALTFSQIKLAEAYMGKEQLRNARISLKNGLVHIKNALVFSQGTKKDYEINIFVEMTNIIEDDDLSDKAIINKLEHMLRELEDLEIAYHH